MRKIVLLALVGILWIHLDAQNVGISNVNFTPQNQLHIYSSGTNVNLIQLSNLSTGSTGLDGSFFTLNGTELYINNRENNNIRFLTNNTERLRIHTDGISLITGDYLNFSTVLGATGYGFRDNAGTMEYKHNGGAWTVFPTAPGIPGNVEYWIRPTAASYIRPEFNSAVKVYDDGQTHGIEYIGSTNTVAGYFETTSSVNGACAVQGFSNVAGNQTYGYLGYNASITVGGSTVGGAAVHGLVNDPTRIAVYGKTTNNATVAAVVGYSDCWIPGYYYGDDNDNSNGDVPGVYSQMDVNVNEEGWIHTAFHGNCTYSGGPVSVSYTSATGAKLYATSDADAIGVYTSASGPAGLIDPNAGYATGYNYSAGAYLQGNGQWVYTAFDGVTNRKIYGTGSVSEIISTKDHGRITLTCPESPEYWYVDYGTVQLVNGKAHVDLDPILVDIIVVDQDNPIKVFIQDNLLNSNGIAVINKTSTGFDLVEKNGGGHSGEVDFQVIAKPKTNYGEGRFPQAPGPAWLKHNIDAADAENQIKDGKVYKWQKDWEVYGYDIEDHVNIGEIIPAGPNHGKYKLGKGKYSNIKPIDKKELQINEEKSNE